MCSPKTETAKIHHSYIYTPGNTSSTFNSICSKTVSFPLYFVHIKPHGNLPPSTGTWKCWRSPAGDVFHLKVDANIEIYLYSLSCLFPVFTQDNAAVTFFFHVKANTCLTHMTHSDIDTVYPVLPGHIDPK